MRPYPLGTLQGRQREHGKFPDESFKVTGIAQTRRKINLVGPFFCLVLRFRYDDPLGICVMGLKEPGKAIYGLVNVEDFGQPI